MNEHSTVCVRQVLYACGAERVCAFVMSMLPHLSLAATTRDIDAWHTGRHPQASAMRGGCERLRALGEPFSLS